MTRSASPGLYLIAQVGLAAEDLAAAAEAGAAACVLLRGGTADEATLRAAVESLRPVAQARDAAFLLEERLDLVAEMGCDGVHLGGGAEAVTAARRNLGHAVIVGASGGISRHAAILAAEAGADYLAFGGGPAAEAPEAAADPELLGWWQSMVTLPCVAMGGLGLDSAEEMARAGADFVALGRAIWDHPQGPEAAARLVAERLARISRPATS
jgi:thiamine-phosphate pyrophosphorylase